MMESPESASPWWRRLQVGEAYLFLIGIALAFVYTMLLVLREDWNYLFPIVGALGALIVAFFCGTRLCLPLYFLTTFGTVLAFPGLPMTLNRAFALLFFLAWLLEAPRVFRKPPLMLPAIFFLLFQVYYLTLALVFKPPDASFPIESLFYLLITFAIAYHYANGPWMRWLFGSVVVVSLLMAALPAGLELFLGRDITLKGVGGPLARINGLSTNAIIFAFCALFAIPFAGALALSARQLPARLFFGAAAGVLVLVALLTFNRQTPIVFLGMYVTFIFFVRVPNRTWLIVPLIVGGLAIGPSIGGKIMDRIGETANVRRDYSFAHRYDKIMVATRIVAENPWLGIGHNYYKDRWSDYVRPGEMRLLHYMKGSPQFIDLGYLQILTEYGIVGLGLFLLVMGGSIVLLLKYHRVSRALPDPWWTNVFAALAALTAQQLLSLLVMDSFVTPRTYLYYGVLFAACAAVRMEYLRLYGSAASESKQVTP